MAQIPLSHGSWERESGTWVLWAAVEYLGLVGLADSGHAGLFRALTGLDAEHAADRVPGVGPLPDARLDQLAAMSQSKKVVPATFQIAFLPGLSTEAGKGLGSRLLGSPPGPARPMAGGGADRRTYL